MQITPHLFLLATSDSEDFIQDHKNSYNLVNIFLQIRKIYKIAEHTIW